MKKIIIYLFLLESISVFAQTFPFENQKYVYEGYFYDLENPGFRMEFSDKRFLLEIPNLNAGEENEELPLVKEIIEGEYAIQNNDGFIYLNVKDKKYFILYYKDLLCYLIDCDSRITYCGINRNSEFVHLYKNYWHNQFGIFGIFSDDQILQSSCLRERVGGKYYRYDLNNKYYLQINNPWIEEKEGSGIDEWIEFTDLKNFESLIIVNGYISIEHPDYYFKNERVKKLVVETENRNFEFELDDSNQIQLLNFNETISGRIKIIIKEIYSGTRYTDTAISAIQFLGR